MQTLIRQGRVVGRTIVLESELGLPDGAPVEVEIRFHLPAETIVQRQQALQRLLSMNLPVADWEQMEQETIQGAIEG
jgi:predicted component of type VI protein secretion system